MNISSAFAGQSLDEIKAALDGGTLTIYTVARPLTADHAVDRSGVLATFTFASPAFGEPQDGLETPVFVEPSVPGTHDGTPGFARATKPDGTVVADFSAGPGAREIKFAEVSITPGAPVKIAASRFCRTAAGQRGRTITTRIRAPASRCRRSPETIVSMSKSQHLSDF